MATIQEQITAIQERLDKSSSDPKWLNDALAEIAASAENVVDAGSVDAAFLDMTSGNRAGAMDFADLCAAQALTGLIPRWVGHERFNRGEIDINEARGSLQRLCGWATLAGSMMDAMRTTKKAQGTVSVPTKRAATEKDSVEDDLPDNAAGS